MSSLENPYAPPRVDEGAPVDVATVQVAMYSASQVAWTTFLGTPFAGAWLLADNDRAAGRPDAAKRTLLLGFVFTLAMFAVGFMLPASFPGYFMGIATTLGMRGWARMRHADWVKAHAEPLPRGGLRAFGIAMACLGVVFALLLGLFFAAPNLFD